VEKEAPCGPLRVDAVGDALEIESAQEQETEI
jgi:hypothetical protein